MRRVAFAWLVAMLVVLVQAPGVRAAPPTGETGADLEGDASGVTPSTGEGSPEGAEAGDAEAGDAEAGDAGDTELGAAEDAEAGDSADTAPVAEQIDDAAGLPGAGGQPELEPAGEELSGAEADARALSITRLRERAAAIDALQTGELALEVDAAGLFEFDLADPLLDENGAYALRSLLASVHEVRQARAAHELELERMLAELPQRRRERARAEHPPFELPAEPALPGLEAEPIVRAKAEAYRAYWRFLVLPAHERRTLLEAHAARQLEQQAMAEAEAATRVRLAQLEDEAQALEALLRGELDVEREPAELLRLGLGDLGELAEDERLAHLLGAPVPEQGEGSEGGEGGKDGEEVEGDGAAVATSDAGEPTANGRAGGDSEAQPSEAQLQARAAMDELERELDEARARVDGLRLRFLGLPRAERDALLQTHRERQQGARAADETERLLAAEEAIVAQAEAEVNVAEDKAAAARREREAAERAAVAARSEAMRRMAEERARLLGVKEAHANYEVELAKRKRASLETQEIALGMEHEVALLLERRPGPEREVDADALYGPLRAALEDARVSLDEVLKAIARGKSEVMPVGEPLAGLPQGVERSELQELRESLEQSQARLRAEEKEVLWLTAQSGRDDIVMLNQARLALLELASPQLRDRMTGFGAEGVNQAGREAKQIVLELRYRLLGIPRLGRTLYAEIEQAPLPVFVALLQLVFAGLVFRYWRRRAEGILDGWRDYFHQRQRGNARLNAALAHVFWYLDRIRRPLELLALCWVVFQVLRGEGGQLELVVVWLVLLWVLLGLTVILLIDSIALHENLVFGGGSTARAELRIRSLRLVGMTIVFSGLVLSLTAELVGEGAIYHWVGSLVWFAAIPVLATLIRWWREPAFRRISDDPEIPENGLVRWIRANSVGLASFPAAAVAGAYLFARGLSRWLLRRATSFDVTRSLLAWMFRREVARQASARREEDERPVQHLSAEDYAEFDPGRVIEVEGLEPPMSGIAEDLLQEIIALKVAHRGTLSAVIGERGAGKSTFLRRLENELEAHAVDYVHREPEAGRSLTRGKAAAKQGAKDEGKSGGKGTGKNGAKNGAKDGEGEGTEPEQEARHEEYGRLTIRRLQCPPGGFRMLQRSIADAIGLSRNTSREDLVAALSEQTPLVFLIDDAHRLVRPAIGGLRGLDDFADFAREVSGDASWIASIGAAAWQYVSRSRGARVFFDQVVQLPRWNEREIGALIRTRSRVAALRPSFDEIVIPQQFDVAAFDDLEAARRPSAEERAERGYYRILWDYARGNPAVALHFWRESLCVVPAAGEEEVVVRLFSEPPAAALDEVGPTMHFVLRGVVQLEIASPEDLVACTQLPPADVADALRFALARGWVDRVGKRGERYRVTWHWYRAITNMLNRQHLLVM